MKISHLNLIFFFLTTSFCYAQQTPVFIGEAYENSEAESDFVQRWRFKNFTFVSSTPQIARPYTTTGIFKRIKGKNKQIEKKQLFGSNCQKVLEMVNSKLKIEFNKQKKEDPKCYKKFRSFGIDEMEITVDKKYMYFEITWDGSYLVDASSECLYPSTSAKIKINEISEFMASE
jgi:hypothetical protein